MKGKLRQRLGRIKALLLDELPYVRAAKRVPGMRNHYARFLNELPPVPAAEEGKVEVHMLCGHRDADMGIWASWSLLRFIGRFSKLVIHDDGTLNQEDLIRWRRLIPGMWVISRGEADSAVAMKLSKCSPMLCNWRSTYKTSPQLVDAHLFGESKKIVVMDSDVLVFRKPSRLIELIGSDEVEFAWCKDIRESYSAPSSLIRDVTNISMPDRFNCGFILSRRLLDSDYIWLESVLEKISIDGRIDVNRYWACQTYYGMVVSRSGRAEMLPTLYDTHAGKTTDTCVVRHYVGVKRIRYRYFEEGVARLLTQSYIG